jgi:hypothetical protein
MLAQCHRAKRCVLALAAYSAPPALRLAEEYVAEEYALQRSTPTHDPLLCRLLSTAQRPDGAAHYAEGQQAAHNAEGTAHYAEGPPGST